MPKGQRHTPEQIIAKLREAEVEIAKTTIADVLNLVQAQERA
jgi:hypothetical protein